jgi:hypothetical protein
MRFEIRFVQPDHGETAPEHVGQSAQLVVVVPGRGQTDHRDALRQCEDRQVVGAGDQHAAA